MTAAQVYNQLVNHYIFRGHSMRQANIFAVRHTWYYFNNQIKLKQLLKELT